MPGLADQYVVQNSLQALTREGFITDNIIDTFFKAKKFFQFMRSAGQVDEQTGGTAITWPINIGSSPNTTTFDGDDNLPILSSDTLRRASVDWKKYTDAISINLVDNLLNDGSAESVANLLNAQVDIMKASLIDRLATDCVVNTTSIDPKGIQGLAELVDDGTVAPYYAGFSSSTLGSRWQSTANYVIPTPTSANLIANMHTLDLQASTDGQRPNAYFTNINAFGNLIQSLFTLDRYNQPEMARTAGGNDLVFNGNPVYLDSAIPTGVASPSSTPPSGTNSGGYIYGINSRFMRLCIHPKAQFAMTDWALGQNNLTLFTRALWFGNLINLKRSAHFVAWVQGL